MRASHLKLAFFALGLLLLICSAGLVLLVKPLELRSFAFEMANARGGCGGAQFRRAVLDGLRSRSRSRSGLIGYSWPNEHPSVIIAVNFAFHQDEYSNDSLFMLNLRKGLRARAVEFLISQDVLLDALCAKGASGQRYSSLPDLIKSLGVQVQPGLRDCEVRAVAHVFVNWESYASEVKLRSKFTSYKKLFCKKNEEQG